jgi:hypothetical protein
MKWTSYKLTDGAAVLCTNFSKHQSRKHRVGSTLHFSFWGGQDSMAKEDKTGFHLPKSKGTKRWGEKVVVSTSLLLACNHSKQTSRPTNEKCQKSQLTLHTHVSSNQKDHKIVVFKD